MAKQKTEGVPVPYPKNWSRMSREERQKWEEQNRGKQPRPVVEPIKPAGGAPPTRPTRPEEKPAEEKPAEEKPAEEKPAEQPGKIVHTAADADAWRAVGADADKIATALDRLSGREIVAAILRGLASALDAHRPD